MGLKNEVVRPGTIKLNIGKNPTFNIVRTSTPYQGSVPLRSFILGLVRLVRNRTYHLISYWYAYHPRTTGMVAVRTERAFGKNERKNKMKNDILRCPVCHSEVDPIYSDDTLLPEDGWLWEFMDFTRLDWCCPVCRWVWSDESVKCFSIHYNRTHPVKTQRKTDAPF